MLKIQSLVIDSILTQLLFALRLPVSRCSLKFHRFLYYVTHYTFFFHLALASLMNKINESKDCNESKGNAGQEMPADFGLPTATFIVIAGMVGTGILTTSGFTVLDVREQPVDVVAVGSGRNHGDQRGADAWPSCRLLFQRPAGITFISTKHTVRCPHSYRGGSRF